jgi:hypothetical protein
LNIQQSSLAWLIVLIIGATLRAQAPAITDTPKTATSAVKQNKDASFSLRSDFEKFGLKPPAQGYNACVVFATLGVIEFDFALAGTPVNLSEQFTEWASVKVSGKRYANFPYKTVIGGIQKYGICTEHSCPTRTHART